MIEYNKILDENLSKLFKRAYEPSPCRPEFRDAVLHRILRRVDLYHGRRILSFPVKIAIAAALLAGVGFVSWKIFGPDARGSLQGSTQDGIVAAPGKGIHNSIINNNNNNNPESRPGVRQLVPEDKSLAAGGGTGAAKDNNSGGSEAAAVGRVRGLILDGATHEPVHEARLTLIRNFEEPVRADMRVENIKNNDGTFDFTNLSPGVYTIFAQASDRATQMIRSVKIAPGTVTSLPDFVLEHGGRARGRVVDAQTGEPIEGALVLSQTDEPAPFLLRHSLDAIYPGQAAARTGADGFFDILHLAPGTQQLRASHAEYAPSWVPEFTLENHAEKTGLVFALNRGGSMRGRVLNAAGNPEAGVEVIAALADTGARHTRITCGITKTNALGEYEILHLSEGQYTAVRVHASSPPEVKPVVIRQNAASEVNFGEISQKRALRGTVRTAAGHVPEGYSVSVVPMRGDKAASEAWKAAPIDASDHYEFTDLDPGDYVVILAAPFGWQLIQIGFITIPEVSDATFDCVLPKYEIRGTVTESLTNGKLARAFLLLEKYQENGPRFFGRTFAGPDGNYQFPCLPEGKYKITAYDSDGKFACEIEDSVIVNNEKSPTLADFKLSEGGSVKLTVRDAAGAVAPGVVVKFTDSNGHEVGFGEPPMKTDAGGVFVAKGMKPGVWRISAKVAGNPEITARVEAGAKRQKLEIVAEK